MNTIYSIFSPLPTPRVSFLLPNGAFAYKGAGYAYIIRPTRDGASATLRITKGLLTKFINAYWPKTRQPKMQDMVLTESGFGWWRVHSLSEVGDASIHRFFRYLNLWALGQQKLADTAARAVQGIKRHYTLVVEKIGRSTRVLDPKTLPQQNPKAPLSPASDRRLQQLATTINTKFGHVSQQVH